MNKKILVALFVLIAILLTVKTALSEEGSLVISDLTINEVALEEGGLTQDLKPLYELHIEFFLENELDRPVTGITVELNSDEINLEFGESFNLASGEDKQIVLDDQLPYTITEGEYQAILVVEGKDFNDPEEVVTVEFPFAIKVVQKPADVVISDLTLEDEELTCQVSTTLSVEFTNIGKNDETDIKIKVSGDDLELESPVQSLSSNQRKVYNFEILKENLSNGDNELEIVLSYRDDYLEVLDTVEVSKGNCVLQEKENQFGKIEFDNEVDLEKVDNVDEIIIIQEGLVAVDSEAAPQFENQPATITFNKVFTNPLIRVSDGFNEGEFSTCADNVCEVLSNSNGKFVFTVPGFSTYHVVEEQEATISISAISFTNVLRGETVEADVTIKNTGTVEILTNVEASLVDVAERYNATVVGTVPETLEANEEAEVKVRLEVPVGESTSKHTVGKFRVTSNDLSAEVPIELEIKSFLSIQEIEINGKSNGEIKLDEETEVKVEVRNLLSEEINDIVVKATFLDVDGDDIEEESDEFNLDSDEDETVTLTFNLEDETLDEDSYVLEIVVEGEDNDNNKHRVVERKTVDVDRESHKVVVKRANLRTNVLQCNANTFVDVTVENIGKSNEDDVEIRVRNSELGINLNKDNIDLDKFSGNDNDYSTSFAISTDDDVEDGSYSLVVEVLLDGDLEDRKDLTLEIRDCLTTTSQDQLAQLTVDAAVKSFESAQTTKSGQDNVISSSLRNNESYVLLLGTLVLLAFVAVVLGLAIVLIKKK